MIIFAKPPLEDMLVELARRGIGAAGFAYPKAAAVLRNDRLAAVAVYHNYAPPDIQMSFYALTPRWAHRSTIRDLLAYPFIQLGVRRVTVMIKRGNRRSRRMVEGLGWKLEGVARKAARDGSNLVIYGMLNTEFGERYGKVRSTFATAGNAGFDVRPASPLHAAGPGRASNEPITARISQAGGATAAAAGPGEPDRGPPRIRAGAEPALSRVAGEPAHGRAQHHDAGLKQQRLRIVTHG